MIIAILTAIVVVGACLAEASRRAYVGHRLVHDMQRYEPPKGIRVLRTEEELQSALRHVSEAERLKARQAAPRAARYAAVAESVTGRSAAVPASQLAATA